MALTLSQQRISSLLLQECSFTRGRRRFGTRPLLAVLLLVVSSSSFLLPMAKGSPSAPSTQIAADSASAFTSIATSGGQKLLQDSYGKTMMVYVDTGGRLRIAYNNSSDTAEGGWSQWPQPVSVLSGYVRPAAVLGNSTSLSIIVE